MAKAEKKVSIGSIDKVIKEHFNKCEYIQWYDLEIKIKKYLGVEETLTFASTVVETCFGDGGVFIPEVKDLAIRSSMVEMYTNLSLPSKLEHRAEILYNTDIIEVIMDNIDMGQYNMLTIAIDDKIEYMTQSDIAAVQQKLNKMVESFKDIENKLQSMFSGVDEKMFTTLVHKMGESSLTEKGIVDAYRESMTSQS